MKKALTFSLIILIPLFIINCGSSSDSSTPPLENNPSSNDINQSTPPVTNVETSPVLSIENNYTTVPSPSNEENITTPINIENKESNITLKFKLPEIINETSGLILLDNQLWTHNDSNENKDETKLYQIDKNNGEILKIVTITNASNNDWEDISYDETYLYLGDFGNNHGDRKDLKVYKIPHADLKTETSLTAEIINFTYSDQTDFSPKSNANNFDCEAMVVHEGKLYLFTKNWNDLKTRLYELETTAGNHVANYKSTFDTEAFVTGATLNKELGILLLTTYSKTLNVNIWSFSNYNNSDFFQGTSKQLTLAEPLQGQVEGITFVENYKAYLSSEAFSRANYGISLDSNLYELNFSNEFE